MKKRTRQDGIPTELHMRQSSLVTVVGDVILILGLVACLMVYISRNNVNTYRQNVENITSIATAESELLRAALDNTGHEVRRAYQYCRGKSVADILDYLAVISGEEEEYQLLRRDEDASTATYHVYYGYSTRRTAEGYRPVEYVDTALTTSLYSHAEQADGDIFFSQNFTNRTDALRYFAVCCAIELEAEGETVRCYLVKPQKESRVLDQLMPYAQYSEVSLAVCYADGKYLASDNGFRAENFFEYLYRYNNLTIDQRNAIRADVQQDGDGVGVLTYLDYKGRDSVFAYASCGGEENWLVVVAVPRTEFVYGRLLSLFPLIIICFLVVLLGFNMWRLLDIVRKLRASVHREQVANASKSSFLSRMSHEIRTPLNAVIGYNAIAQSAMSEAEDDAGRRQAEMKVLDCLSKSEIASKHLLSIINDVLDMSAIESGKIQVEHARFDFRGLITSLTTVFYSQAKAQDVTFEVLFDTLTEEWFVGDQMRVNQILTNILSNAVKFTPAGGRVVLKICQPEAEANAAHIRFEITDTGIGMTPEYLSHIWTPFEQEDSSISRRFGGTGLGLSITKNLVDLMGGSISVTSEHGTGTTFRIDLTFSRTEQPEQSDAYEFSSVNALVVDDDPSTCDYIRLLFGRFGAHCTAVTSGADALAAFQAALERKTPYTLCLVDWRMPHMDGIETIRRLRALAGDALPITVLTAYDYTEVADQAAQVGVSHFLSKPLFQSSLFDLLANQREPEQPTVAAQQPVAAFAGLRVLLAEDNVMNMEIAKAILKSAGLTVDGAWNGQEAVDLFEAAPPGTYAAILMDVHMPVLNGHEATRAIRSSDHPDAQRIPIIAMTADAFAENVAEAHAAGMNAHIAKPIDIPTLMQTLMKFL